MLILLLGVIVAVALTGLAVKAIQDSYRSGPRITWREYAIGMALAPFFAALVAWAGWAIARNNLMTFTEYWNGWETAAVKEQTVCHRDGSCRWDYNCDPYLCPYECGGFEGTGNNRHYVSRTCWKTCWHSCPYVNAEYEYFVDTTLGRYTIASGVFPESPQAHRWRVTESIPQSIINAAGVGDPAFWVATRDRCQADQPGPVTARREYKNYILASDHTLMKEHSSDVISYRQRNLLPPLAHGVTAYYHADKISFVGWQPSDRAVWQSALEYLNAALGSQLQGDLRLVIIKDDRVAENPERYALALKAYWQDKASFDDGCFSKNGLAVLIGTADGTTVSWSRAFTGMPLGNEKLIVLLRDGLKGQPLTSGALIGPAFAKRSYGKVAYPPDGQSSALQRMLWGLDDPSAKFTRVSMSGKDGKGGFLYLKNDIQPTARQTWTIFAVTFVLCCVVWVWASFHEDPSGNRYYR